MIDKEKIKKIICHFGTHKQIRKAVEELIELSELLIKYENKGSMRKDDLYEEIADVEIMLEQIMTIFNMTDEHLQQAIDWKLDRTLDRIGDTDCAWK